MDQGWFWLQVDKDGTRQDNFELCLAEIQAVTDGLQTLTMT